MPVPRPGGIGPTEGVRRPSSREGLPLYGFLIGYDSDEEDRQRRQILIGTAWEGDRRQSYEAQVYLARYYRLRLVGFVNGGGTYREGPFDKLTPTAQQEVLELCNRQPKD